MSKVLEEVAKELKLPPDARIIAMQPYVRFICNQMAIVAHSKSHPPRDPKLEPLVAEAIYQADDKDGQSVTCWDGPKEITTPPYPKEVQRKIEENVDECLDVAVRKLRELKDRPGFRNYL